MISEFIGDARDALSVLTSKSEVLESMPLDWSRFLTEWGSMHFVLRGLMPLHEYNESERY